MFRHQTERVIHNNNTQSAFENRDSSQQQQKNDNDNLPTIPTNQRLRCKLVTRYSP